MMRTRDYHFSCPYFWDNLAFRLSKILLIIMIIPGTYVFRHSNGPDAYTYIHASYIIESWNPLTYITFALALVGYLSTWLARKYEKCGFFLSTVLINALVLYNMFRWCRIQDMMFDKVLMFLPPIIAMLSVLSAFIAWLLHRQKNNAQ